MCRGVSSRLRFFAFVKVLGARSTAAAALVVFLALAELVCTRSLLTKVEVVSDKVRASSILLFAVVG